MTSYNVKKADAVLRVVVTGACSDIGQSISYMVAQGRAFGKDRKLRLVLCDNPSKFKCLKDGLALELGMCMLQNVVDIECTVNMDEAFKGADAMFLCGGVVPNPGFSRNDIISLNALEYKAMGLALHRVKASGKVLVVTEPPNSNMEVLMKFAPGLKPKNVTGLIKVAQNRSASYIARRLDISVDKVRRLTIWGNKSKNMVLDLDPCIVEICDRTLSVTDAVQDDHFIKNSFTEILFARKAEIETRRKTTACLPVASAAIQHMYCWVRGTPSKDWCNMVVLSDGSYGIDEGLAFSFPVKIDQGGEWEVVQDLAVGIKLRESLDEASMEVKGERDFAFTVLGLNKTKETSEEGEEEEEPKKPWSFGMGAVVACSILKPLEAERMATF